MSMIGLLNDGMRESVRRQRSTEKAVVLIGIYWIQGFPGLCICVVLLHKNKVRLVYTVGFVSVRWFKHPRLKLAK